MRTYYGVKRETRNSLTEGFRGRVYHFDMKGEKEIEVFTGPLRIIKALAVDDAAEWLEEHNLEATADGSW